MKKWKGQPMRKFVTVTDECKIINHFPEEAGLQQIDFGHGWLFKGAETSIVVMAMSTQAQNWYWNVAMSEIDGPINTRNGEFEGLGVSWEQQLQRLELNINMSLTDLTQGWLPRYLPSVD